MKDPAFLFYSNDFYEGTRTMLPQERACYIDLLIYQHQHGAISIDLEKILRYCTGIDEATLIATLEAKFEKTEKGWINKRLNEEIFGRETAKKRQSISGKIGQFWKKAKAILNENDFAKLRQIFVNNDDIITFIDNNDINESTLKATLKVTLKAPLKKDYIYTIGTDIEKDRDKEKGGMGEKTIRERKGETREPSNEKVQFAEFVSMTNVEYSTLVTELGDADTKRCIEILDNYKGSKGQKYKSDYRAIRSWVTKALNEEKTRQGINNQKTNVKNEQNKQSGAALGRVATSEQHRAISL